MNPGHRSRSASERRSKDPSEEPTGIGFARGAAHHPFELAPLSYSDDALEPVISRQTVALHHDKHHRAYVDKLNELVQGTELARLSLLQIVEQTRGLEAQAKVFQNAGQALNHDFYWRSLSPRGGRPAERLMTRIESEFGSWAQFVDAFAKVATEQFGTGWAWLVLDGGALEVLSTSDADSPFSQGVTPLLTIDVWEHAYYLDYQNRREDHVRALIEERLDWDFALENLTSR